MATPTPALTPPPPRRSGPWGVLQRLLDILYRWAESGWAGPAALTWSLLQSSIIPGPSDAVFLPLGLADPKRAVSLSLWTTAGAMIGGLIAYMIGALAFDTVGMPIVKLLGFTASDVRHIETLFISKGWLVIFLGSLPILSSKLTAMAAGAFGFPVLQFLLASFMIRGLRFIIVGFCLRYGGEYIREWLNKKNNKNTALRPS